jgi:hypothetical protein
VWSITTRSSSSAVEVFYVLEATCEVVGHPPSPPPLSPDQAGLSKFPGGRIPLRADWSAYIEARIPQSSPSIAGRIPSLMEHLKWTNHEEYERGMSTLWLRRIQNKGQLGVAKLVVAERYILACVVGNRYGMRPLLESVLGSYIGISLVLAGAGCLPLRWHRSSMASHHGCVPRNQIIVFIFSCQRMLQVFPSLISFDASHLSRHHHVESLYFTAPDGTPLHPALAAVQTPAREYYVLRDNGMQVGCEEDGVALVWRKLLGCDAVGRPGAQSVANHIS